MEELEEEVEHHVASSSRLNQVHQERRLGTWTKFTHKAVPRRYTMQDTVLRKKRLWQKLHRNLHGFTFHSMSRHPFLGEPSYVITHVLWVTHPNQAIGSPSQTLGQLFLWSIGALSVLERHVCSSCRMTSLISQATRI